MTAVEMARLSNDLFVVTVLTYSVAMLAYAVDFAFGRSRVSRRVAVPAQAALREPALVAAGAAGASGVAVGAGGAVPAAGDGDGAADGGGPARRGRVVAAAGPVAVGLTAFGWSAHLAEVITRGVAAGRVPWGDMYEFSSMAVLVAVGVFLLALTRANVRWLGTFVLLPAVLYLGLAGTVLYVSPGPLVPALHSYWLKIHVVAAITATGTLMISGVVTCLHLMRRHYERVVAAGGVPRLTSIAERMPTAAALDRATYRIVTFAFPIWTFAIVAGAIWAESAWGRYWGWDPKETWSFITWVGYAAYLHARSTAAWRRAAPALALLAFGALLVNYYVINTVIAGLHSYAF